MSWLNKNLRKKKKGKNVIQYQEVEEDPNADGYQEEEGSIELTQDYEYEQEGQINGNLNANIFQTIDINNHQFEEQKTNNTSNSGIQSDAWPDEASEQNKAKAKVHNLLSTLGIERIDMRKAYFRELNESDIEEVKNLHEEWFPLTYGKNFYEKITKRTIIAIGCFYDIHKKSKKKKAKKVPVILGAILTRIQEDNDDINEIYTSKDMQTQGITGWISSILLCRQLQGAYIMTIGVVDEARRYGLGTMLLKEVINRVNQQHPNCEAVYLHVVDYNESAIRFYEKNDFSTLKRIKSHYLIFGKEYDALVLYKDIKFNAALQEDNEQQSNRRIQNQAQGQEQNQSYISYFIGRPYTYVKSIIFGK